MKMGIIHINHSDFENPGNITKYKGLRVDSFRYNTGVDGLRLANERGYIEVLPFHGHQIWYGEFDGQRLGMESIVTEPKNITDYLRNYGAFVVHCGPRRIGPSEEEGGDLHGTLPNARFGHNMIECGDDNQGPYIAIKGIVTDHRKKDTAFRYRTPSTVKMHAGKTIIDLIMEVHNNHAGPMEIMRLEHVNFLPVAGSELVYSAPCTRETVTVRTKDPKHAPPQKELIELREKIIRDPALHNIVPVKPIYDPEIVLYLKYRADRTGWAHSMQVLPNGNAHYIAHRPSEFPIGIRWMRMVAKPDEKFPVKSALGLCLPSTAEPEGYREEKRKGNVKVIPFKGAYRTRIRVGLLGKSGVSTIREHIENMLR
jgi:hypothetical protein